MLAGSEAFCAELKVMSYNLRYASDTPPNAWPARRPLVREVILESAPDIIGTQEGVYRQLRDVAEDLPAYDWIGLGRDGGSKGEFMAVFFRKDRLDPVAFDHFWLSDTPNVIGSTTWGNSNRRMVTWIRFRDKSNQREFVFFNTHFDHEIQPAREKSAELLLSRVKAIPAETPVVVTGDFNCTTNNLAYQTLTAGGVLHDTWYLAAKRAGEDLGTFNGFRDTPRNGKRIDWILSRGFAVSHTAILDFQKSGQFPSDHFPIIATLSFKEPR
jgi:endonuclease/exonuclease/phosphatase family metal-dependent hydrolase